MTARTPSQRGTSNRRKGHQAERDLCRWLRVNGEFGDARLPQRFWSKVTPCPTTGCWLWNRPSGQGYGQIRWNGRRPVSHRLLWEVLVGPVPEGLELDHLCRVRRCVNPEHLEPVSPSENVRRGVSSAAVYAARAHCEEGHAFTPENTYHRKSGGRECATCASDRMRTRRKAAGRGPGPAAENAAKTHCLRGHELSGDNLHISKRGKRICRTCGRDRTRQKRAAA